MGVHISKVRSLELDTKEWSEALVTMMSGLGNTATNQIWQASASAAPMISPDSSSGAREAFIRQKYGERAYVGREVPLRGALHAAALSDDVVAAATCLAHGGPVDEPAPSEAAGEWTDDAAAAHGGRSALQLAAAEGSEAVLEFLLQNAAAVDAEDPTGKTALMLAVIAGEAGCVGQLITRGANISHADHSHATPMSAAEAPGFEEILQAMLTYKLGQDEKLLAQVVVE